jgi:serine/threonine protein kinase
MRQGPGGAVWLSDAAVEHLRVVAEEPDLSGTRYELLGLLGRGGMGSVYRARDRELGREVALKVSAVPVPSPGELERLRREAQILARLEHPGVVPVHDLGLLPDGRLYYAMKLVRGTRLDEHVGAATLPARLRIFERICEAVAFAHAQGVVHRDLKPDNVMVGAFGEVLVLDWGVAKVVGVAEGAAEPAAPAAGGGTAAGTVLGTPGYMSPEQARGDVDRIDQRSDVYALGAILRWLAVDQGAPRSDRALTAIWTRAGAARPDDRYATVAELAADVARYLAGERVQAHPEGPLESVRRLALKHRTPLALVAAYLAMRVLLAFFTRG